MFEKPETVFFPVFGKLLQKMRGRFRRERTLGRPPGPAITELISRA